MPCDTQSHRANSMVVGLRKWRITHFALTFNKVLVLLVFLFWGKCQQLWSIFDIIKPPKLMPKCYWQLELNCSYQIYWWWWWRAKKINPRILYVVRRMMTRFRFLNRPSRYSEHIFILFVMALTLGLRSVNQQNLIDIWKNVWTFQIRNHFNNFFHQIYGVRFIFLFYGLSFCGHLKMTHFLLSNSLWNAIMKRILRPYDEKKNHF